MIYIEGFSTLGTISRLHPHAAEDTAIFVVLHRPDDNLLAGYHGLQVFTRRSTEGLRSFGRINSNEAHFMQRAIRIKHLYRIPVRNGDDATCQFMRLRGSGPRDKQQHDRYGNST